MVRARNELHMSSVGGASNGPSSGCPSATVAGLSFGSAGYSGRGAGGARGVVEC
jgi:hypothetical protein